MRRFQLGIVLSFAFQVHLPEHVESGLFAALASTCSAFVLQRSCDLPALCIALDPVDFTILEVVSS